MKYIKHYDIIHVHLFPSTYWVAFAKLLLFSKAKLIMTEHSTDNRRRHIKFFKIFDKFIYKIFDKIISISPATTSKLNLYLGISNKIITIFNGIDIAKFQKNGYLSKQQLFNLEENKKLIVQVANFRNQKDQDTVIKALSYLSDDYYLALIGDGERKKICENLAKKLNLKDRVLFCGIRSDIPQIMKSADIVVMSSHNEGFGRAAIEGMAAGKPLIASNVPGLAEVVEGAGLLFEVGDSTKLALLIKQLIDDDKYYEYISKKCIERANKYDVNIMVNKYEQVYNSLV